MAEINHAVLVHVSGLFKFWSLYIKLEAESAFVFEPVSDGGVIEAERAGSGCSYNVAAHLRKKNNVIIQK